MLTPPPLDFIETPNFKILENALVKYCTIRGVYVRVNVLDNRGAFRSESGSSFSEFLFLFDSIIPCSSLLASVRSTSYNTRNFLLRRSGIGHTYLKN